MTNKDRLKYVRAIVDDRENKSGLTDEQKEALVITEYYNAKSAQAKIRLALSLPFEATLLAGGLTGNIPLAIAGALSTCGGLVIGKKIEMDEDLDNQFYKILQHIPDHGYEDY